MLCFKGTLLGMVVNMKTKTKSKLFFPAAYFDTHPNTHRYSHDSLIMTQLGLARPNPFLRN